MAGTITFGIIIATAFCFPVGTSTLLNSSSSTRQPPFIVKTTNGKPTMLPLLGTSTSMSRISSAVSTTIKARTVLFTTVVSSCGGYITVPTFDSRKLRSPNYPQFYPNNAECVWYISTERSYRIKLHFYSMDTEKNYDFVSVYGGHTVNSSARIAMLSGTTRYDVLSSSNSMTIKFSSDARITRSGFYANVTSVSESNTGPYNYTQPNGLLMSPYYPMNYHNGETVLYYITAFYSGIITLHVSQLHTESNQDYLAIYDGSSEYSRRIKRLSGHRYSVYTSSTGPHMTLKFESDNSITDKGFLATYTTGATTLPPRTTTPTSCGGTIHLRSEQYIHSLPNYPYQRCVWYISTASGYRVKIHFTDFATEYCCGYVAVYAGHRHYFQIARFKGPSFSSPSALPYDIISGSEQMTVVFDSYGISNQRFGATLSVSTDSQTGVHRLDQDRGYIMSPNFPNPYNGNYKNVVWYITVSPGNAVEVTVSYFNTEHDVDVIYFYDGCGTSSSKLIARVSNTYLSTIPTSCSNSMTITFSTDPTGQGTAFVGTFKTANPDCYDYNYKYSDGLSVWQVIAIAVGSLVVFALIVGVALSRLRNHRQTQSRQTQRSVQGFRSASRLAAYNNAGYAPSHRNLEGRANHIAFPESYEPPVPDMPLPSYAQALQMPIYSPGNQNNVPTGHPPQNKPENDDGAEIQC